MDVKLCIRCGEVKPLDSFYRRGPASPEQRSCLYWCKPCVRRYMKLQKVAWRQANAALRARYRAGFARLLEAEKRRIGIDQVDPLDRNIAPASEFGAVDASKN